MIAQGKLCKYCDHIYMRPCQGKDENCQNHYWINTGKNWPHLRRNKEVSKVQKPRTRISVKTKRHRVRLKGKKRVRLSK